MKLINTIIQILKDLLIFFLNFFSNQYRKYHFYYNNVIIKSIDKVSKDTIIWKYTYIWYNTNITKTIIWNYCSIANNVSIWMWEHDLNKISTNSIFYKNQYKELTKNDCIIWNDVWIWVDSIIRRWVTIWNWAIIWANSFVNKNIPPYAIAVWNPAKIIKYRFNKEKIEKIKKSKWWKYNKIKAEQIINKL